MKYRKLRIAWSVVWGVVAVLLVVFWVRSYWHADQIYGHTARTKVLHFGSMRGQLTFRYLKHYNGSGIVKNWLPDGEPVSDILRRREHDAAVGNRLDDLLIYRYNSAHGYGKLQDGVYVPHWLLVIGFAVLSAAPWL